jgi:hypothetical protein
MTATLQPGMTSPWHTHSAPVIVMPQRIAARKMVHLHSQLRLYP